MDNTIQEADNFVKVEVAISFYKEGEYFVVYCPALDLAGQGKTQKKAIDDFSEVLRIFIEETKRKNTLQLVLLNLGWKLQHKPHPEYRPPTRPLFTDRPRHSQVTQGVHQVAFPV